MDLPRTKGIQKASSKLALKMHPIKFHIQLIAKQKRLFIAVIIGAIVANFLQIIIPLIIKEATDAISEALIQARSINEIIGHVEFFSLSILLVSIIMAMLNFSLRFGAGVFAQKIIRNLRNQIMCKYLYMPYELRVQKPIGDLMSRMTLDVDFLREWYAFGIRTLMTGLLTFGLVYLAILYLDWRLFLILLIFLPIYAMAVLYWPRKLGPMFYENRKTYGNLTHIIEENIMGIRVVRAYNVTQEEQKYLHQANEQYLKQQQEIFKIRGQYLGFVFVFATMMTAAVVLAGGYLVIQQEMSIGTLVAAVTYMGYLYTPARFLGFSSVIYHRANAGAARIIEVLDFPEELSPIEDEQRKEDEIPLTLGPTPPTITFENIWFRYPTIKSSTLEDPWTLKNITLELKPSEKIALIGPTGCGKSTLVHLLLRLYKPTKGRILLNGINVECYNLRDYRRVFGFVPQETFLFQRSIEENIKYADPKVPLEDVYPLVEATKVSEFIGRVPEGFETNVGERGHQLSGGQRQRIALARALVHDPRILILDDALSAVDADTEAQIYRELNSLLGNKTVIIITHRISTLKYVDRVVLMVNGEILEMGTVKELRKHGKFFPKLLSAEKTGFMNFSELYEEVYQPA